MNYNTIKDKQNINELTSILASEETRLNNQKSHSVHLVSQEAEKSSTRKPRKNKKKKGSHNLNETPKATQVHKKKHKIKCYFYNQIGHLKKDCLKQKAQFEKKGKPCTLVCFKSNLTEVPFNTWWINSGSITHISNTSRDLF